MEEKIIIDAEDEIMGRLASYAAKAALLGNKVFIVNSELAVISGRKEKTKERFIQRKNLNTNNPEKGPFFSKSAEKIMKRCIRGMLPDYRKGRGKEAWRRIRCYQSIPEELKKEKMIRLNTKVSTEKLKLKELGAR